MLANALFFPIGSLACLYGYWKANPLISRMRRFQMNGDTRTSLIKGMRGKALSGVRTLRQLLFLLEAELETAIEKGDNSAMGSDRVIEIMNIDHGIYSEIVKANRLTLGTNSDDAPKQDVLNDTWRRVQTIWNDLLNREEDRRSLLTDIVLSTPELSDLPIRNLLSSKFEDLPKELQDQLVADLMGKAFPVEQAIAQPDVKYTRLQAKWESMPWRDKEQLLKDLVQSSSGYTEAEKANISYEKLSKKDLACDLPLQIQKLLLSAFVEEDGTFSLEKAVLAEANQT